MPVITDFPEWEELKKHVPVVSKNNINKLIQDPDRINKFVFKTERLLFDITKNKIDSTALDILFRLAEKTGFNQKKQDFFSGKPVNTTENRPALHHALRSYENKTLPYPENIRAEARQSLASIETIYNRFCSTDNKKITDVIFAGIGGSITGPKFLSNALKPFFKENAPAVHFLSSPVTDVKSIIENLDPKTTIVIIASKSFSSVETIKWWSVIQNIFVNAPDFQKHCLAITAAPQKAIDAGFPEENIVHFPTWTGGRYSIWSAISLPVIFQTGPEVFHKFLNGAAEMDHHFFTTETSKNIPLIFALLDIWHSNGFEYSTRALLPYHPGLSLLTEYVQQLEMESNGKSFVIENGIANYKTSGIVWGLPGTDCQHSFMQLLHQGTGIHPAEFVGILKDSFNSDHFNEMLVANMIAQSTGLACGSETGDADEPYRRFPGDRPATVIFLKEYTPEAIGSLLAFYEHRTFAEGAMLSINSFDQWGVELGKQLAVNILDNLNTSNNDWIKSYDKSTQNLLQEFTRKNR
ncbi:MAG: glucose-6-phosphate isomerase [Leptospirales bacterium]